MTSRDLQLLSGLAPSFRGRLVMLEQLLEAEGIPFSISDGYRSEATQRAAYEHWLATGGANGGRNLAGNVVPSISPPGRSKHEVRYAADLGGPRNAREWQRLGELAESIGLGWGGRWARPEVWHVEDPRPRDVLARLQESAGVIGLAMLAAGFFLLRELIKKKNAEP